MVKLFKALLALGLTGHSTLAARNWIWAGGTKSPSSDPLNVTTPPMGIFSNDIAPGQGIQACMAYSSKRHQLIYYLAEQSRVFVYDIARKQWACLYAKKDLSSSAYPKALGDESSVAVGPSARAYVACTLAPAEGRLWVFGGSTADAPLPLNELWSFNLHNNRWSLWYGDKHKAVSTNYKTGILGSRMNANIGFFKNGILTIMNGFDGTTGENVHDVWQFNVASKRMSLVQTLPLKKTALNAGGYFGPAFVPSPLNKPHLEYGITLYHNSANGSVFLMFGGAASYTARFDVVGRTANQYTPLRGSLEPSMPSYFDDDSDILSHDVNEPENLPQFRSSATILSNPNMDYFGIYGGGVGFANGQCDDFWMFNLTSAQWTLLGGDSLFCASNRQPSYTDRPRQILTANPKSIEPGTRYGSSGVLDKNGVFWMFGGVSSGKYMADLWVFTETDCNAGSYFDFTNFICQPCPVNTFTSRKNSNSSCQKCPANSSTNGQTGATKCTPRSRQQGRAGGN